MRSISERTQRSYFSESREKLARFRIKMRSPDGKKIKRNESEKTIKSIIENQMDSK